MKKLLFLLAAATSVALANAQKVLQRDVPSSVKTSLQKQFPDAKNVKWEKEDRNYEAGFKVKETGYSVLLNASGNVIETEVVISINSLGSQIKEYVAKNYPGHKIKEAAKITDGRGIVTYEAEVNGKDLIFDNAGNFLKEIID